MVEQSLQGVYCIYFHIYWKKLNIEMLIKVSPGLDREGTSIQFLSKEVLRLLGGLTSLEEC